MTLCPCDSKQPFAHCCEPLLTNQAYAETAEQLMRSRYTAYTLLNESYLLKIWHSETRPKAPLMLDSPQKTKWLGLKVHEHIQLGEHKATVRFTARYKPTAQSAQRLTENSLFIRDDYWYYVSAV